MDLNHYYDPFFLVLLVTYAVDDASERFRFEYPTNVNEYYPKMTQVFFEIKKEKLTHQSFRIEEEVVKALGQEAIRKGISVSSLVNRTLKNYVTHEMQFEELGFILVSKEFLRKVFNIIENENHIEDFGREFGLTIAKEYVSYFYPQVNSSTLILFLNLWFRRFQTFRYHTDAGHRDGENKDSSRQLHCYTVTHDINVKFSFALKSILGGLIEPVIKRNVEFKDMTATSITFSFETNKYD